MDSLTGQVRELYSQYPFPNADYRMDYGLHLLRFFSQAAPAGRRSFLEGAKVLDAGCGTGNALVQLAAQFPSGRFWGVDLTPASVEIARAHAARRGLTNISFQVDNILTMDLAQGFDVVISLGVLHHTADMACGIKNLGKHLRDGGYLVLWLYGTYGRFRLNLNQAMFRLLFQNVDSLGRKVALAKRALASLPRPLVACHFNVPRSEIEDDFDRSLEFAFENEVWLVDQFLHVNEQTVNMEEILALLDQGGLRLVRWLSVSEDISSYTEDEDIRAIFRGLDPRSQLLVLDLLIKPKYYLVVAQRANEGATGA
jgi:SAM-dependent methyltransferase